MAREVSVVLIDDLDGSPAQETVQFGLDGLLYEIDLSDRNAMALRNTLHRYLAAARRIEGPVTSTRYSRASRPPPPGPYVSAQNRVIRFWARQRGITVPAQGRVPTHVIEAYHREQLGWAPPRRLTPAGNRGAAPPSDGRQRP